MAAGLFAKDVIQFVRDAIILWVVVVQNTNNVAGLCLFYTHASEHIVDANQTSQVIQCQ